MQIGKEAWSSSPDSFHLDLYLNLCLLHSFILVHQLFIFYVVSLQIMDFYYIVIMNLFR
jgi:hypothetical protein